MWTVWPTVQAEQCHCATLGPSAVHTPTPGVKARRFAQIYAPTLAVRCRFAMKPRQGVVPHRGPTSGDQRLFYEVHAVLAEEHLLAHEEGRRTGDAADDRMLRDGLEPRLDVLTFDQRLEVLGPQARAAQHGRKLGWVAQVLGFAPHGVEDRVAIAEEAGVFGQGGAPRIRCRVLIGKCGVKLN